MNLKRFFQDHRMDEFAVLRINENAPTELSQLKELLPGANSLIIFAKAMFPKVYQAQVKIKTFYLRRVIFDLDKIADELSELFRQEKVLAAPVPCFFPVRVSQGKLRGFLSLKRLAALGGLGSLGQNTLLINERHGNRLALGALLTEKKLPATKIKRGKTRCLKCRKCIKACPTRAISAAGVDIMKCLNVRDPIPKLLRPLFKRLLSWRWAEKYMEMLVNSLSWKVDMVCSECLTQCPFFRNSGDTILN